MSRRWKTLAVVGLGLWLLLPGLLEAGADVGVGDTTTFWAYDYSFFKRYYQVPSVCRVVGDHCYLFTEIDTSNALTGMAVNPNDGQMLFAFSTHGEPYLSARYLTDRYLYRTANAGLGWSNSLGPRYVDDNNDNAYYPVTSAVYHPTSPTAGRLLVGTGGDGVFFTLNNGTAWTQWNQDNLNLAVNGLDVSPRAVSASYTVYAATEGGVYKRVSTPPSEKWRKLRTTGLPDSSAVFIAAHPTGLDTVLVAVVGEDSLGQNVYRGIYRYSPTDSIWVERNGGLEDKHVQGIYFDPGTPTNAYALTPAGPYKSTDGGATWVLKGTGLTVTDCRGMAFDPLNSSVLYLATWGGGIYRSSDGGELWGSLSDSTLSGRYGFGLYAGSVATDPVHPNIINLGAKDGFYRTTDGGSTWAQLNTGLLKDAVSDSSLESLRRSFDQVVPADSGQGIYEFTTGLLGNPPDADSDPRIYLLVLDVQDDYGTQVGEQEFLPGYFSAVNETAGANSNLREILYIDEYPLDVTTAEAGAAMTNGFATMILWALDASEERWVTEGIAAYAEFTNGYTGSYEVLGFPPGNDLTYWGDGTATADRTISFLFFEYLAEHYGGQNTIRTIAHDTANGISGVSRALAGQAKTLTEIFPDWLLACYLDDTVHYGGLYGFRATSVSCATGFIFNKPQLPPYFWKTPTYSGKLFIIGTDANFYSTEGDLVFNGDNTDSLAVRILLQPNQWSAPRDTTGAIKIGPMALNAWNEASTELDPDSVSSAGPYRSVVAAVFCTDSVGNAPATFVFSNDVASPVYARVGVFQNVGQDRYLDVYAYGSEYLYTDVIQESPLLQVSLGDTTRTVAMDVFSRPGTDSISTVYHADVLLDTWGTAVLSMGGEDAAGNDILPMFDTLTVQRVLARQGGDIAGPDGAVALSIPAGGLPRDMYVTVNALRDCEVGVPPPGGRTAVTGAYRLGPEGCELTRDASLAFGCPQGYPAAALGVYRLQGDEWVYQGGAVKPDSRRIELAVNRLGTFQVQAGPHGPESGDTPSAFALYPVAPNPVRGSAVIRYDLPARSHVSLKVYNLLGQLVSTVRNGVEEAGFKSAAWDGRSSSGRGIAAGVYFYELIAGSYRDIRTLVLLR